MRNLIWIVLAAVVLGGGYMLFTGKSVDEVVDDVTTSMEGVEAPAPLEEAATAVGEAVEVVGASGPVAAMTVERPFYDPAKQLAAAQAPCAA